MLCYKMSRNAGENLTAFSMNRWVQDNKENVQGPKKKGGGREK